MNLRYLIGNKWCTFLNIHSKSNWKTKPLKVLKRLIHLNFLELTSIYIKNESAYYRESVHCNRVFSTRLGEVQDFIILPWVLLLWATKTSTFHLHIIYLNGISTIALTAAACYVYGILYQQTANSKSKFSGYSQPCRAR